MFNPKCFTIRESKTIKLKEKFIACLTMHLLQLVPDNMIASNGFRLCSPIKIFFIGASPTLVDSQIILVMGGIENFLSRLLKDKIPRYHGILPCSDFYILINILLRNLHLFCNY